MYNAATKREVDVAFCLSMLIGDIPGSNEMISMLSNSACFPCRVCLEHHDYFQLVPEDNEDPWVYRDLEATKKLVAKCLRALRDRSDKIGKLLKELKQNGLRPVLV